jgi:phosphoglycolate phosphatase
LAIIHCGPLTFTNIRAILFDKDGTLANTEPFLVALGHQRIHLLECQFPGIDRYLQPAFGLFEQYVNPDGLLAVGSRRDCEIATAAAVTERGLGWVEALVLVEQVFEQAQRSLPRKAAMTPVIPGITQLLRSLSNVGIQLGIISADVIANIQDFVEHNQLQSYIRLQMGVDSGLSKPNPELLYNACRVLGVELAETLVIGDSEADMRMARAAGVAGSIGVDWAWQKSLASLPHADIMLNQVDQIQVR